MSEEGPHSKLTVEELGKWMNIANQNALEREAWADRYDRLHIALCQACECLNRGDSVTAHNIIRERLDTEMNEIKFCGDCGNPSDHMIHRDEYFRDGMGKIVYHEFQT